MSSDNNTEPVEPQEKSEKIPFWKIYGVEGVVVLVLYIIASFVMFSPFAPLGKLSDTLNYGDAVQFTFFLSWGHHVLLSGDWASFFALPISHPLPMAGGLTDILPGVALTTLPFRLFTSNPVLIYNLSTLLYGTLNGFFFYILCRGIGAIRPAAFVAGFMFSFNGFMQWHAIGHLSVLSFCWAPLVFLCVWNCIYKDNKYKWAVLAGLFFFMQALSSSRLGIIALLGVFLLMLFAGVKHWKMIGWRAGLALFLSLIVSLSVVAWLYSPALVIKKHLPSKRSMVDVAMVSVDSVGYFIPNYQEGRDMSFSGKLYNTMEKKYNNRNESRPYLGWSLYLFLFSLLCGCLFYRFKDRKLDSEFWQEHRLLLIVPWLCMGIVAALLSLGPYLWFKGEMFRIPLPWLVVIKAIPPLATFRAIARFALLVAVALCLSIAVLWTYMQKRSELPGWVSYLLAVVVLLVCGADYFVLSTPKRFHPTLNSDLTTFLQENSDQEGAVMMCPFPGSQNWLLELIPVYPPVVNSFHGGLKNDWITCVGQGTKNFTSEESVEMLQMMGIRWIIDRNGALAESLNQHPGFEKVQSGVYELSNPASLSESYSMGKEMVLELQKPVKLVDDFPGSDTSYMQFNFQNGQQGWFGYNTKNSVLENGIVRFTAKNNDPLIYRAFSPPLDSNKVSSLQVKYRTLNSLHKEAHFKIYWQGDDKKIGEKNSYSVIVEPSDEWKVITFPLSNLPNWGVNHKIYQLRLDPENPSLGGTTFEFDEIRVVMRD